MLRVMWELLDKSPARRGDVVEGQSSLTSSKFHLKFCPTRWVENVSVATRAIELWQDYMTLIKEFLLRCASKRPQNILSYDALLKHPTDESMIIKFSIFKEIATVLMGFLKTFQTTAPMMPFLSGCIERVLRLFLEYFVKRETLQQVITASQLVRFNVAKPEVNCLPRDVKLPTASGQILSSSPIPVEKKTSIKQEYVSFLKNMVNKLQERSPLKHLLVRCAASLSPVNMAVKPDECVLKFEKLVNV